MCGYAPPVTDPRTTLSDQDPSLLDDPGAANEAELYLAFRCEAPLAPSSRHDLGAVDEVLIGRGDDERIVRETDGGVRRLVVRLADPRTSSSHVRLVRLRGGWELEDAGSKNGTIVNGAIAKKQRLGDRDVIELGRTLILFRCGHRGEGGAGAGADQRADLPADALTPPAPSLATFSRTLSRQLDGLSRLATATLPLLVLGETGTGKEVVARAAHTLSGRSGPFLAVNCGSLPATLVESELFGYKKGAFSGATDDRPGLVRAADGGTLFLDEIGDLPLAAQATLLRVLQEREVLPVGGTRAVAVDLRVVAATHRDLEAMVAKHGFRRDLLARLSGHRVRLPALVDRLEDLGLLIAALLERAGGRARKAKFSVRAARALWAHTWPENVRELEQALASAIGLAGDATVDFDHLPEAVRKPKPAHRDAKTTLDAKPWHDDDASLRETLVSLLREHKGNVAMVARAMGKARMQIHRWVKRYGLSLETFRS